MAKQLSVGTTVRRPGYSQAQLDRSVAAAVRQALAERELSDVSKAFASHEQIHENLTKRLDHTDEVLEEIRDAIKQTVRLEDPDDRKAVKGMVTSYRDRVKQGLERASYFSGWRAWAPVILGVATFLVLVANSLGLFGPRHP